MRPPIYQRQIGNNPRPPFLIPAIIAVVLLIAAFQSISFYVDNLWFESLGYESVYWYGLRSQATVFFIVALATGTTLWLLFRLMLKGATSQKRPFLSAAGEMIQINPIQILKSVAPGVAAVLGLLFGIVYSADWTRFALYFNQTPDAGPVDPVFAKPIAFYLFTLPVMESLAAWLLAIAIISMIAAIATTVFDSEAQFVNLSMGLALVLAALAVQTYVSRFTTMRGSHELFTGVNYVDDHVIIPGLWFVIAALLIGAAISAVNIRAGRVQNLILAVAAPALAYIVAGIIVPAYVSTFVVRPNQLVRETPYISRNIDFTREAYGLNRVERIPFEPRVTNAVFDPAVHAPTLDNIRLWDWRALQATLRQIQEIRTYYEFPDVDVDRYVIDGKPAQMMLSVRELSLDKLPAGSRNWVNERLIYTHGYGVTMNPVNRFTNEGLPELILSNMPVVSTHPEIKVTRPEVYFGEMTNWPVYVKTGQQEFNYPEGEANNYITYNGTGGIRMGGILRRLLLAWTVGDLMKVPFSDDITADSSLLIRRDIRERVSTITPFLMFDDDPYIVVGEDGGLYWIMDAFTASNRYPYSQGLNVGGRQLNYMRNSVKAVVDAYNGTVHYYVFDDQDPVIKTYQKMFPELFLPAAQMPSFLRSHVRYPDLLFQTQALMYATYHVENEQVFYNHEDIWTVAEQNRTQSGKQESATIEPLYILMQFPGETTPEFVNILPFTPSNRNNLIGWMAARSDGEAYGSLRAYEFPKTRFVDGPSQIQARIDQDPQLSSQLTLWNQQGSTVIRGNLLVIPLGETLLFAEPVYLQAERSPMPELRLVVLATQDRLAYATRFPDALRNLLAGTPVQSAPAPAGAPSGAPSSAAPSTTPDSIHSLIDRANQSLADYRRLTAEGKLGEAGARLEELNRILQQMNQQ